MRDIQKERAEILRQQRADMKLFRRLPKGYEKWLKTTLFNDRFMAYDNKKRAAFCTVCNTEHQMPKRVNYHNNAEGVCPNCGAKVVYHRESLKMGRETSKWVMLVQSSGNDLLIRFVRNVKVYTDNYRKVEYIVEEKLRQVFSEESDRTWQYFWGSDCWLPWCDEQYNMYRRPTEFDVPLHGFTVYKPERIADTIKDTWARYSGLECAVKIESLTDCPWGIHWYITTYRRKPELEKLVKVGFHTLVYDIVLNAYNTPPTTNGNTIADVFGISKYQAKLLLRHGNPTAKVISLVKEHPNMSIELFDTITKSQDLLSEYWRLFELERYAPVLKIAKYLSSQSINVSSYADYIHWLELLGYTLRKDRLFPADLKQAHDNLHAEYKQYLDEQKAKEMAAYDKVIKLQHDELLSLEPVSLKMNGLMIVVPTGRADLVNEGEALHHCVATYAERVAKKQTIILFIRKEEEPNKPYYTLEWKGSVQQCRGFANKDMTADVKEFVNRFETDMRKLAGKLPA